MKNFGLPKFMLLKHGALPQFLVCEVSPTLERGKHRNKLLDEKGAHKALLIEREPEAVLRALR